MRMTVRAVYEHGVLRPLEPLALSEGDTVDITIVGAEPAGAIARPPTPEEEDYAWCLKAAGSLDEMFAVMVTGLACRKDTTSSRHSTPIDRPPASDFCSQSPKTRVSLERRHRA